MISIACPSYKRTNSMIRLVDSVIETVHNINNIEVIFYLDDDDYESHATAVELMKLHGQLIKAITGPKIKLSNMWNHCANETKAEIVMLCGDDILFRTKDWDNFVIEQFNLSDDKIIYVHGDDGHHGTKFGTHGFLHRNWINTVGYFLPPYFSADWCDTWINEVADKLNRRVFIPILTEHMHYSLNKSQIDQTHQERLERDRIDNNKMLFDSKKSERDIDFLKLKMYINENILLKALNKGI